MAKENRVANVNGQARVRPVHSVRLGRISAAIWANETKNGVMHNVTITRLYKDAEDAWQRSQTFGLQDLPLVARVSDMALTWIYQQTQEQTQDDANSDVPF